MDWSSKINYTAQQFNQQDIDKSEKPDLVCNIIYAYVFAASTS